MGGGTRMGNPKTQTTTQTTSNEQEKGRKYGAENRQKKQEGQQPDKTGELTKIRRKLRGEGDVRVPLG